MGSSAGSAFDRELNRVVQGSDQVSSAERSAGAQERLDRLCQELKNSGTATNGLLDCQSRGERLFIVVRGQPIGEWTQEGSDLTLYRAGSDMAECQATSVNEAVKLTARLVAAMAQA